MEEKEDGEIFTPVNLPLDSLKTFSKSTDVVWRHF